MPFVACGPGICPFEHQCAINAGHPRCRACACGSWTRSLPNLLNTVRATNVIVREEIAVAGLDGKVWQAFAVLADVRSVGVMGDERTYVRPIISRSVASADAMTADWNLLDDLAPR